LTRTTRKNSASQTSKMSKTKKKSRAKLSSQIKRNRTTTNMTIIVVNKAGTKTVVTKVETPEIGRTNKTATVKAGEIKVVDKEDTTRATAAAAVIADNISKTSLIIKENKGLMRMGSQFMKETMDLATVVGAEIVKVVVIEIDNRDLKNPLTIESSTNSLKSMSSQTIDNSTALTIAFFSRCFNKNSLLSTLS